MVTIAEAADRIGCSAHNVRKFIERNNIETEKRRVMKLEMVTRNVEATHVDIADLRAMFRDTEEGENK